MTTSDLVGPAARRLPVPGRRARRLWRLLIVVVFVAGCTGVPENASGAEIFALSCARCHGTDLGGGLGPALGAGAAVADQPDEYLTTTIARGKGRMPSFSGALSDEQIGRVVAFIREHHD